MADIITLGDKRVSLSQTLMVPDGTVVQIEHTITEGDQVKLRFSFSPKAESGISWVTEGDFLHMTFHGWNNALGTTMKSTAKIGATLDGRQIGFIATGYRIAETTVLHFQLLVGGSYD